MGEIAGYDAVSSRKKIGAKMVASGAFSDLIHAVMVGLTHLDSGSFSNLNLSRQKAAEQ